MTSTNPNPVAASSLTSEPTDLSASLLASPTSAHHHHKQQKQQPEGGSSTHPHAAAEDAARHAMSHTSGWKPALDRRQSWSAQEYKHELLRRQLSQQHGDSSSSGFTEAGRGAGRV